MAIKIKKTSSYNGSGFYPQGEKGYVYLTSLQNEESEEAKSAYSKAQESVFNSVNQFSSEERLALAYSSLNALIAQERAAENQFLSSQLKISLEEVQMYGFKRLIESFNKILNLQSTYRSNIERIKMASQTSNKNAGQMDRLYSIVNYELPVVIEQTLKKILGENLENIEGLMTGQYDDLIKTECAEALTIALQTKYGIDSEADKEYAEFAQIMRSITASDPLISNIMKNYGISGEQLRASVEDKTKKGKQVSLSNIFLQRRGGNVFEDFVQKVIDSIKSDGKTISFQTGALNNMKADHIITVGINNAESLLKKLNYDNSVDNNSVRLKNIQLIENFLNSVEKANSSIVFVSDKNYNLKTSSFAAMKGFGAERPTLENLGGVLSRAGIDDIDDLIFGLANTGNMRINPSAAGMERYMATKIANFLFDDVVITDSLNDNTSSINRIHIFNLGNVYVPLSVLLQGVYTSLITVGSDYTQYVNVKYSPTSISYTEETDGLDPQDWDELYNSVIKASHVAFHFFGNFMDFVRQYL